MKAIYIQTLVGHVSFLYDYIIISIYKLVIKSKNVK